MQQAVGGDDVVEGLGLALGVDGTAHISQVAELSLPESSRAVTVESISIGSLSDLLEFNIKLSVQSYVFSLAFPDFWYEYLSFGI